MRSKSEVRFLRSWVVLEVTLNVAQPILVATGLKPKVQLGASFGVADRVLIEIA